MPLLSRSSYHVFLAFLLLFLPQSAQPEPTDHELIAEALSRVRTAPRDVVQYDYDMTVRVRFLFFWAGKDDVGGGYIRRGVSKDDPREELLQVLFGSDPAKAPRAINRWGGGTEMVLHKEPVGNSLKDDDVVSSVFFGFMKSSQGKSVSEMQSELKKEQEQGLHLFTGILSRVEQGHAVSLVVPLFSKVDYNLNQYAEAEPLILDKLSSSDRPARSLPTTMECSRPGEFLGTVARILGAAIENPARSQSLCYVYDAQVNNLVLEHTKLLPKQAVKVKSAKGSILVDTNYDNLLEAEFVSIHQITGKRVHFTILAGTEGELRGVPVQIRYQPNWWFQIVLNLLPSKHIAG